MALQRLAASLFVALAFVDGAHAQQSALTCETPEHRAFDFWLGDWEAYLTGTDTLVGRAQIRAEDRGCVITEYWALANGARTGRSLNIYDRATGRWEQFWTDSAGDRTHYIGAVRAGGIQMIADDDVRPNGPTVRDLRITFSKLENDDVRQLGEASTDNGATWTVEYDLTFRPSRRGANE
jgi:hypothetical protein